MTKIKVPRANMTMPQTPTETTAHTTPESTLNRSMRLELRELTLRRPRRLPRRSMPSKRKLTQKHHISHPEISQWPIKKSKMLQNKKKRWPQPSPDTLPHHKKWFSKNPEIITMRIKQLLVHMTMLAMSMVAKTHTSSRLKIKPKLIALQKRTQNLRWQKTLATTRKKLQKKCKS